MDIRTHSIDTTAIIELQGRLDAHQGKQVDTALSESLTNRNRTIINLKKVHFIDSTGLAILVKGMKHHREQAGEMVLCELQQPVRIIFELTRLDRVFNIYPTETDALHAIQLA